MGDTVDHWKIFCIMGLQYKIKGTFTKESNTKCNQYASSGYPAIYTVQLYTPGPPDPCRTVQSSVHKTRAATFQPVALRTSAEKVQM